MKRALITGISGQDGAYLSKLLLDEAYEVFGAHRISSRNTNWRLQELGIADRVKMVPFDMLDTLEAVRTLQRIKPTEIYNLGAHSFVASSFQQPVHTAEVDALGVVKLLEVIRTVDDSIRFYQASSSEMFGSAVACPQSEETPFHPRSPYGVAKLFGHWTTVNYRETYGMHASSGILFNHESPLRGEEYVTRKIARSLARLKLGLQDSITLGNLDAQRDWGYAGDYVKGMWLMLQRAEGDDYVLSSGVPHSVRQFVEAAAHCVGLEIEWCGAGLDSYGMDAKSGKKVVTVSEEFYRPPEKTQLLGNPEKAKRNLGWKPEVDFQQLIEMLVKRELERASA